jgi:hypothetical protein
MHANSQPETRTPSNSREAFSLMTEKKDKKENKSETYFLHTSILCCYCVVKVIFVTKAFSLMK